MELAEESGYVGCGDYKKRNAFANDLDWWRPQLVATSKYLRRLALLQHIHHVFRRGINRDLLFDIVCKVVSCFDF